MNTLYPIFLKTDTLQFLLIGGGVVALEKLQFLYKSSPNALVTVLAPTIKPNTMAFIKDKKGAIILKRYHKKHLNEKNIVIAATGNSQLNQKIKRDCMRKGILLNVADSPELCDFYLGGIVTKGNLKIAISTHGKSPIMAKRLRQYFEEIVPDETDDLLNNLREYRQTLKKDFQFKVKALNALTQSLLE